MIQDACIDKVRCAINQSLGAHRYTVTRAMRHQKHAACPPCPPSNKPLMSRRPRPSRESSPGVFPHPPPPARVLAVRPRSLHQGHAGLGGGCPVWGRPHVRSKLPPCSAGNTEHLSMLYFVGLTLRSGAVGYSDQHLSNSGGYGTQPTRVLDIQHAFF